MQYYVQKQWFIIRYCFYCNITSQAFYLCNRFLKMTIVKGTICIQTKFLFCGCLYFYKQHLNVTLIILSLILCIYIIYCTDLILINITNKQKEWFIAPVAMFLLISPLPDLRFTLRPSVLPTDAIRPMKSIYRSGSIQTDHFALSFFLS